MKDKRFATIENYHLVEFIPQDEYQESAVEHLNSKIDLEYFQNSERKYIAVRITPEDPVMGGEVVVVHLSAIESFGFYDKQYYFVKTNEVIGGLK